MHEFDPHLMGTVLGYVTERLALTEPPIDGLGDREAMRTALQGLIGDDPRDPREVLDVYVDHLADTIMSADSPRFLAFIPAAPTEAALLFDMVVSAASLQGCSWLEAAGAVMAENQALETLARIAGMPPTAGGVFVSGGSAGNLSALVVARDTARHRRGEQDKRFQVIVSDQSHSSIANALNICWMEPLVITTTQGRLTREDLHRQLEGRDLSRVAAIVGTAGTTNAGIIDDLDACADLAHEHGWWFHVDGAYGGAGMLDDRVRDRYRGIERADSLVMDPHKWWFAPFDSAALIYREPHLARAVHTQDASYLDVIHTDDSEFNPSDLAFHLTRRARGMALWFSLAVNGLDAYRDAVRAANDIARYAADRIRETPGLELLREPDLSVVLFRVEGWSPADYDAWGDRLLREQIAFVTPSKWCDETVARLAFLHPATSTEVVDEVLATLQ